ncbi:hypothetical protein MHU86_6181 [Fragilaria crotonensis]|nr:hypothetical protein MHU86_6181 [Fragilaria crotonensis]
MVMKLTIVHVLLAWTYTTAFQLHQQKQKLPPTAFLPLLAKPHLKHGNADHLVATRRTHTSLLSMTINTSNDNRAVLMNGIDNDNNDSKFENYEEPIIDKYGRITWTNPPTTASVTTATSTTTTDSNVNVAPEIENQSESSQQQETAVPEVVEVVANNNNVDTVTPNNQSSQTTKSDYSIHRKLLEFRLGSRPSTSSTTADTDQNEVARIEAEEAKAAAEREEAARIAAEEAKAAAEREEAARIKAEEAKAAAEREEAARIEAEEAKAAAEREEAARIEAEAKAAAEREEAARIEAEAKEAAEREEAARIAAEAKAAAQREEAARVEAKAAAEREKAARIEADAKAAAEREDAARIEAETEAEAKAAAELEEAARVEADAKVAAEPEEAPAVVEEQLKSNDPREDSSTTAGDNMLGGLMSSIEKKLREENVGLGLKRTDFAPPIPPPPDVGVDKTVAVALKRSNGDTKKPASFVKVEATPSTANKLEKLEENPDDKKSTVLSTIKGKKDALLRIAKEKPKLVLAAALVLVLVPTLFGTILRGSMR